MIRRLGPERVLADERAAAALIGLCARLPLALNIVAARAALHPERSLAHFAAELHDAGSRLDALTTGDGAADVRVVLSWSYETLDVVAARVFRQLGLHPGADIDVSDAAAVTALEPSDARSALDRLTAAHLLTEHAGGRYFFHDLLRAYAAEQSRIHDTETERLDALLRVCDFYVHTAHAADRLLAPHRPQPPLPLASPMPCTLPHVIPDAPTAMAWFDAEHANLLAAQRAAAARALHPVVLQLAWALTNFQFRRGHREQELAVWQASIEAAAGLADPAVSALVHRNLGAAYADSGRHPEAIDHLHRALAISEEHHDPADQAHTHYKLAWAWAYRNDDRQAMYHAERALELFRPLGEPEWEARALNTVGWYAGRLGDYDTARAHCQGALTLYQRYDNPNGRAATFDSLGYIDHHTGRHRQAVDYYRRALALRRGLGSNAEAANTLEHLGHPYAALGERDEARAAWSEALELFREQGRADEADRVQARLDALADR